MVLIQKRGRKKKKEAWELRTFPPQLEYLGPVSDPPWSPDFSSLENGGRDCFRGMLRSRNDDFWQEALSIE